MIPTYCDQCGQINDSDYDTCNTCAFLADQDRRYEAEQDR